MLLLTNTSALTTRRKYPFLIACRQNRVNYDEKWENVEHGRKDEDLVVCLVRLLSYT